MRILINACAVAVDLSHRFVDDIQMLHALFPSPLADGLQLLRLIRPNHESIGMGRRSLSFIARSLVSVLINPRVTPTSLECKRGHHYPTRAAEDTAYLFSPQ